MSLCVKTWKKSFPPGFSQPAIRRISSAQFFMCSNISTETTRS
jgi:hypothetical protein